MDEQDLQRLNELLGQQGKSVSDLIRTLNARISRGDLSRDVRDALAILNKNSKKLDESQKKQIDSLGKLAEEVEKAQKAFAKVGTVLNDVGGTLFKLGDASQTGAEQISFYTKAVEGIPFVGGAINELGKSLDFNIENFRSLASIGADFGQSLIRLRETARDARLPLLEFTNFVADNNANLAGLFGSTTQGAIAIAQLSANVRDQLIPQFAGIGITTESLNDFLGTFLVRQRIQGRQDFQNQEATTSALANYTRELDQVAKLTGIQRDQLDASIRAQQADAVFQTFLQTQDEGRATQLQALAAGLDNLNPAVGDAVKNILATGFPLGQFEQTLVGTTGGLLDNILALRDGTMSTVDFAQQLEKQSDVFLNQFGPEVLRAAGNVGEVGNGLIAFRNAIGTATQLSVDQAKQSDGLTGQIGVTQEAFRRFKAEVEGIQTGFLQEFGPNIASVLVGTDKGLENVTKNLRELQAKFPREVAAAVIGANLLRYGANIGKEIGIVAAGVRIGSPGGFGRLAGAAGRGAGILGVAGLGAAGMMAGRNQAMEGNTAAGVGMSALSGALSGAIIGSMVPVIGTAVGAGLGAIVGGLYASNAAQRQFGGSLSANQPALVGERGPELFIPNNAGNVEPMLISKSPLGVTASNPGGNVDLGRIEEIFSSQNTTFKQFADMSANMEKHLNTLVGISAKTEKNTENSTRKLANLNSSLV